MSDSEAKAPDFYNKKNRLLTGLVSPLVIIVVGGLVIGIFVLPMFEDVDVSNEEPKLLTTNEGIELGLNQNDEILLKMDQIIKEQKYHRELLEDIYDQES